jgi:alpha-N-arabinofuranosidase
VLTPTYHVFEMYNVHHDATLLPLDLRCDEYSYGEQTMPGISASASRDTAGRVHLSLCNLNPSQAAEVRCEVRGMALNTIQGRVLTADRMTAHNTFDAPEQVRPTELRSPSLQDGQFSITLPAMSVVVLELG